MDSVKKWLAGKKTYLTAGALSILGIAVVVLRPGLEEVGVGMVIAAGSIAGLGDRLNRHQAEVLTEIRALAQLVEDAAEKKPIATISDAIQVIDDAIKLKQVMTKDTIGKLTAEVK
jgi:hypothetical protein